jgi:uncharacterized protein (TIGR03067 family)
MKTLPLSLAALLFLPAFVLADAPQAGDDLQKFEGTWKITSWYSDGKEVAPKDYENFRRVVKNGVATWSNNGTPFLEMKLSLDPTQSPKTLDSTVLSAGDSQGKIFRSIYEFTSDNEMRAATALPDKPRPTEFKSDPGSQIMLFVFQRIDE